jgi:RNase P/RNase MRP subunit p29
LAIHNPETGFKKGRIVDEKTREKLRLAQARRPSPSPITREKLRLAICGPGGEKFRMANKDYMNLPETRAKYSIRMRAKHLLDYPGALGKFYKGLFRHKCGILPSGPLFEKYIKAKVIQHKLRRSLNV